MPSHANMVVDDACIITHTQFNETAWNLGRFAVEADAAAARDSVAKVIGYRLNFKKPRKITGQRSNGAA